MSKVFSVNIALVATAYIRADTVEEAVALAQTEFAYPNDASVSERTAFGEIAVSGTRFDSPGLPKISLSPALTFHGSTTTWESENRPFGVADFECVEDDAPEAAEEDSDPPHIVAAKAWQAEDPGETFDLEEGDVILAGDGRGEIIRFEKGADGVAVAIVDYEDTGEEVRVSCRDALKAD